MPALPQGIIVNSTGIEGSIDRIDNEPLDQADIAKLWKVYTITQRRLLDPTSERLENLWWRIWGSRKKQLKGAVVARLFAQISDGQSFVPLRGPPDDDERRPPANTSIHHGPGASSTTALHRQNRSRPSTTTSSSTASKAPVPMPHPILKKTRGPSTTGPRPTARFISPHESQDDSDQASSVSPNAHVVIQPPSGPPSPSTGSQEPKFDRKSATRKKTGFVASTGKKRRPLIVKRQSSQTSQSSTESPVKNYDAAQAAMGTQSSSERTPPSFAEQSRKSSARFQENFSPASERPATKKSPKKRELLRSSDAKSPSPRKASGERQLDMVREQQIAATGDPGPSRRPSHIENDQQSVQSPTAEEMEEIEMQRVLIEEANARLKKEVTTTETTPQESQCSWAPQRPLRSKSEGKLSSRGKGVASLAPTLTAVSGQMDLGDTDSSDAPPKSRSSSASLGKGKGRDPEDLRRADMFTKRPVPPVPSVAALDTSDTLSRSKSQLTLLLERDRARSGEKKSDKGKGKGSSRGKA